jgi:hypothetical protein
MSIRFLRVHFVFSYSTFASSIFISCTKFGEVVQAQSREGDRN